MDNRFATSITIVAFLLFAVGSAAAADLKQLFPEAGTLDPGMEADEYMEYDRSTLYDYIDGGAEVYLDLDFVKVGARDYIIELEEETYITLDVYDMSAPVNAYGIFSIEDHADLPAIDIGVKGYTGGGALTFWAQRYYVKIRADDDSDKVHSILKKMAEMVADRIGNPGTEPAEVALFPEKNRIPGSERYSSKSLMGIDALQGFSRNFGNGDSELTLHLCSYDSAEEATAAEQALVRRLRVTPGEKAYPFNNRYLGFGKILRTGRYLAVVQGSTDAGTKLDEWGEQLASEFFGKVAAAGSS